MTIPNRNEDPVALLEATEYVGDIAQSLFDEQSGSQRFSNLIVTIYGVAATVIGQIAATGLPVPDWGNWVILAITLTGTVLGIYRTKNGFTPSQIEKLNEQSAKFLNKKRAEWAKEYDSAHPTPGSEVETTAPKTGLGTVVDSAQDLLSEMENLRRAALEGRHKA